MKITAIHGALHNHQKLFSRLQEMMAEKNFSTRVIFPTLSMLRTVQDQILNHSGLVGIGGIRFLLFEGFIQDIQQFFALPNRNPSPMISEMILADVFKKLQDVEKIDYLSRVPFTKDYRRAILDGIAEWQRSCLPPGIFKFWGTGKEPKLAQLAVLYQAYYDSLVRQGYTSDQFTLQQLSQLNQAPLSHKHSEIIIYGFTDLTPLQSKLLQVLESWFDFEAIVDPTQVPEFQQFVGRHFTVSLEFEKVQGTTGNNCALQTLQNSFWVQKPASYSVAEDDFSIQLIQAAGWLKQATGIAREISLLRQSFGYQPEDFLILTPQPQQFIHYATPVFQEYHVYLPKEALVLKDLPAMNRFTQILNVVSEEWKWPQMEVFIRHCYSGNNYLDGDRLLLEIGERYGALSGQERWLKICRDDGFKQYFQEKEINIRLLEAGIDFLTGVPKQSGLKNYLKLARNWFINSLNTAAGVISRSNGEELAHCTIQFQGIQQVIQCIDEMISFLDQTGESEPEISLLDFHEFWADYLFPIEVKTTTLKSQPELRVLVPKEARGLQAKAVFICGLEQGVFPRYYIHDWKLSPSERQELKSFGVDLETGEQYQLQEKLAFYWSLQAAQERLYLVAQDQDGNGQPLNPSSFLDEVWQWLPDLRQRVKKYGLAPEPLPTFQECYSGYEMRSRFASCLIHSSETISEKEVATCLDLIRWPLYREIANQIRQDKWSGDMDKLVFFEHQASMELLNCLFNVDYTFAITALEDYQKCPYRFFLKHLLNVKPLRRPQLLPDHLELGDLYHQIFQEFYDSLRGEILIPEKEDEYRNRLEEIFASFYREWEEDAANELVKLMLALQEGQIRNTLNRWLKAEIQWVQDTAGRYRPKLLEFGFGLIRGDFDPASIPNPYQVEVQGSPCKIWGKVDRIDIDENGCFIVYDYKLGRGPNVKEVLAGSFLQIPVYLMALEELHFGAGKGVGGCYLGLKDPSRSRGGVWHQQRLPDGLTGKGLLDPVVWQEWQAAIREILGNIVGGIRQGKFRSINQEQCLSYCEYKSCCQGPESEAELPDETSAE